MRLKLRPAALLALSLLITLAAIGSAAAQGGSLDAVGVPNAAIPESNDFATRTLGDPWDMSQYEDISHYLNESGQRRIVNGPSVAGGVFSGRSFNNGVTGDGNPYFFPLFPGYSGEVNNDPVAIPVTDRLGFNHPMSVNDSCLYVAVNSQSSAAIPGLGPDLMRIYWFADRRLNGSGGAFGMTYMQLYPEAGAGQPTHRWQVISLNLKSPPNGLVFGNAAWSTRSQWQGLRIDPTTTAANTPFAVDWVRLTNCAAVNRTITWTPDATIKALWLRPSGTTRDIRLTTVNGASGSASIDFQGVAAGTYQVGLGTLTSCCSQRSSATITINQAPAGQFAAPSFTSGEDYATQAGNSWDFAASSDGPVSRFTPNTPNPSASYGGDGMLLTTPPGPLPGGIDVAIDLNTPAPFDPNLYRYLTVDMETSWLAPWENIPDGMIGRWIWSIQGTSGRQGRLCTMVGPDIPYDIGRQEISLDLLNPASGDAEERSGECPAGTLRWTSGQVLDTRFDPNENVTGVGDPITGGGPFTQRIRSIRLTKVDTAQAGGTYLIQMNLNEDPANVNATFYYTTNLAQPTQNQAARVVAQSVSGNEVFLPMLRQPGLGGPAGANPLSFDWNLAGVAPGTYYICARLGDGLNTQTVCSKAPLRVQ